MSETMVRLTVTDVINGQRCEVTMTYLRELWYDVNDADREELRLICRYRYSNWAYKEYGVMLSEEHLDALPVTAA